MKILIEMPEPRRPECEVCGLLHGPKEVCPEELQGIYMEPQWLKKEREMDEDQ